MRAKDRTPEQNKGGCGKKSDLYKIDPEKCKEQNRAYHRQWHKDHRDRVEVRNPDSLPERRERAIARKRKWSQLHRSDVRTSHRQHHERARLEMFEILGGAKCVVCGYDSNIDGLQIDHIAGDGHIERKQYSGGNISRQLRNIKEHPERFQALCGICHNIKTNEERRQTRLG